MRSAGEEKAGIAESCLTDLINYVGVHGTSGSGGRDRTEGLRVRGKERFDMRGKGAPADTSRVLQIGDG